MSESERILGKDLALALEDFRSPKHWPTPEAIDRKLDEWERAGVEIQPIGRSREGRQIRAAVIPLGPSPTKTMLAWGYPHPDEPIGAAALLELGDAALRGRLRSLGKWSLVLVPCADPDNASRQLWLQGDGSAREWARGVWRPSHLGLEVDYGFPIRWGPFDQPPGYRGRCRTAEECRVRCGGPPCSREGYPWGPLPESLALTAAIGRWRPEVIAAMHSTHTSGDYTFLLRKERGEVFDDLLALPEALGSMRHLGEAIDRGRAWRRGDKDLIKEETLEARERKVKRREDWHPGAIYRGNAAAAAYIEALPWEAQFVCPETALFRSPVFADTSETSDRTELQIGSEKRRNGLSEVVRFHYKNQWTRAHQRRDMVYQKTTKQTEPTPRSVFGVKALLRRRETLARADEIWDAIDSLPASEHPYREEREATDVPGAFVGDRSMLIFRTREDYRRAATRAQEYSFRWIWPLHTASLLGNLVSGLRHEDQSNPVIRQALRRAEALQGVELAELPDEMMKESDRRVGMASQVGRIMCLMKERDRWS